MTEALLRPPPEEVQDLPNQSSITVLYEEEKTTTGMTALAGLPVYLELTRVAGLSAAVQRHVKLREGGQGWSDGQVIMSLILLNRFDFAHYRPGRW